MSEGFPDGTGGGTVDTSTERCFTVLTGLTPAEALQTIILQVRTGILTPQDAEEWGDAHARSLGQVAYAGEHAGWTWVLEVNGYAGSVWNPASHAPPPGRYISVFWNVNAVGDFVHVRDGQVVRRFDPLFRAEDPQEGEPTAEEEGLDWAGEPWASALTLQNRLSGVTWPGIDVLTGRASAAVGYAIA